MNGTNDDADKKGSPPRAYSSYNGFKSFAHNGALSIDDIVKGLSHLNSPVPSSQPPVSRVEPIYENVEPIVTDTVTERAPVSVPADIRGYDGNRLELYNWHDWREARPHSRTRYTRRLISSLAFVMKSEREVMSNFPTSRFSTEIVFASTSLSPTTSR